MTRLLAIVAYLKFKQNLLVDLTDVGKDEKCVKIQLKVLESVLVMALIS